VFIDGGTDHYGDKVFDEYVQIWNLEPGWQDIMERRCIDLALISARSRLAEELVRDRGWSTWYSDSTAVILRKPAAPSGEACHPERSEGA
jgi:hypothetical protein